MSKDDRSAPAQINARSVARSGDAREAAISEALLKKRLAQEEAILQARLAREEFFHRHRPVAGHGEWEDDDRELTRSRRR